MFLSSFQGLRKSLLAHRTIRCALHMPYLGKGGTSMGINFGTVATVFFLSPLVGYKGHFSCVRYYETNEAGEPIEFPVENDRLRMSGAEDFRKVPGNTIAYWISAEAADAFGRFPALSEIGETRIGLITGENSRYIRFWHEVELERIGFGHTRTSAAKSNRQWFPQSKGGNYRRWYGNNETVVDWSNDGNEMLTRLHESGERTLAHNFNLDRIFQPAVTWTKVSSGSFSARMQPDGFLFNDASANLFIDLPSDRLHALAFLNSALCPRFLEALNPTLNFLPGNVSALPLPKSFSAAIDRTLSENATDAVALARADWDNFETSWDFRDQPFLRPGLKGATLQASWQNWEVQSAAAIRRMQELETENNRLFIEAYGLEGELQPEVSAEQITLTRADQRKDMAAFLSYAIGCMMGRYSLDKPGLILANAGDSLGRYLSIVGKSLDQLAFVPDKDGIIPVLDGEWFEDDIVARSHAFLRATFGEATLDVNLRFIEESLGKGLRKYFLADFYKDHLQTYKKRPIYWLFSSGKERAFQCLVYLHRYHDGTLARTRTEYVIPLQGKMAARIEQLASETQKASSTSQRRTLEKERDRLLKQQTELRAFDEKLRHYADQRMALDLDDGVKVNYGKFGDLLAEVKAVTGGNDED